MSAKPLTIVQILPALNSGGVERCTLDMARALVATGHRSIVISQGGQLVPLLLAQGSEHYALPVHCKHPASLLQIRPLRRLLRALKPDIVHARSRMPAWLAWLALRKIAQPQRPKFITSVHGLNSINAYSAIMMRGERVIAISETVRDFVLANYPACPKDRLRVIYEGIDPAEFPWQHQPDSQWLATWHEDFPALLGKRILALPGRLVRLKGHDTFIRLIKALRQTHPDIHGLIIGGADSRKQAYATELRQQVHAHELDQHITFCGARNDMANIMSQCDLLLSLSTQPETFGRTVLEALLIGRPVLGWNTGGVSEILQRMFPYGLVANGDDAALLAQVKTWLDEPCWPEQSDHFQLSESSEKTIALYRELLG